MSQTRNPLENHTEIKENVGPIDVIINNAGIHHRASQSHITIEEWNQVNEVNLNAVFFISQQVCARVILKKR